MNANIEQTIRGLQFRGGICVAAFCKHFAIRHPFIDKWVLHKLVFVRVPGLTEWEALSSQLEITGLGYPLPKEVALLLNDRNREPFTRLIDDGTEIGMTDMYSNESNEPSLYFRRCCKIAAGCGVNLPFRAQDTPVQIYDWGEPIDDSLFQQLLADYADFVPANETALRHKLE